MTEAPGDTSKLDIQINPSEWIFLISEVNCTDTNRVAGQHLVWPLTGAHQTAALMGIFLLPLLQFVAKIAAVFCPSD